MNPSTEDILDAISSLNSENIYVFPNNKNVIMSAQQAKTLSDKNVIVVPTTAVTQTMSCMLVFDAELSADENSAAFEDVISTVKSAQITNAVRDTSVDDIEIKEGEYLTIVDGEIKASDVDLEDAVFSALELMVDSDSSTITVFAGEAVSEEEACAISDKAEEKYPDCDVMLTTGGQPVYHYLISVE